MPVLSNRTESDSEGCFPGEDSTFDVSLGWQDDGYSFAHQNADEQIIQLANHRVNCLSTLKKYKVPLEEQYSRTGWNHKSRCPFHDHNDMRPSFGYNSQEDRFHCFGCNRSGRTVEFIAFMEGRSRIHVAKSIVGRVTPEEIMAVEATRFDRSKLKQIIFDYADFLRDFKRRHGNTDLVWQYAEDVTWSLDVYLGKHARHSTMILEELEARVNKLKDQLELFQP